MPKRDSSRDSALDEVEFIRLFRQLQKRSSLVEKAKGLQKYKNNPLYVPTRLFQIASETVEAMEWHRVGASKEIGHDLADIVLRTIDLAEHLKIDLGQEIINKYLVNIERSKKKSKAKY